MSLRATLQCKRLCRGLQMQPTQLTKAPGRPSGIQVARSRFRAAAALALWQAAGCEPQNAASSCTGRQWQLTRAGSLGLSVGLCYFVSRLPPLESWSGTWSVLDLQVAVRVPQCLIGAAVLTGLLNGKPRHPPPGPRLPGTRVPKFGAAPWFPHEAVVCVLKNFSS